MSVCGTVIINSTFEVFLDNIDQLNLLIQDFIRISGLTDPIDLLVEPLPTNLDIHNQSMLNLLHCVTPKVKEIYNGIGISTDYPSPTPFGFSLGPTNLRMINIAGETLGFRWFGFSPNNTLLIPTFALPHFPPNFTIWLQKMWDAPLPSD